MVAVSRFVEFSVTGQTLISVASAEASGAEDAQGTRGYSRGTGLTSGVDDSFTIVLNDTDQMKVDINGSGPFDITLASGTDLDPRFVARDIEFKLHAADSSDDYAYAQCNWRNGGGGNNDDNSFIIYTGQTGNNTGDNDVTVTAPTSASRDCRNIIGFDTVVEAAGTIASATQTGSYTGTVTTSGSYSGQFDDFYTIMIADGETVADPVPNGGNTYEGTSETGGLYTGVADDDYIVTITTTNGSTMGAGAGNVPTFTVTDTPGSDANSDAIELLYHNHWYDVGDLGVRIRFTDAVFGNGDTFAVAATTAVAVGGAVGVAKYIWSSYQEDSSKSPGSNGGSTISPITTTDASGGSQLGTRGVTVAFGDSGTLTARDRFSVICRGPTPIDSDVTQLNFGNVTVSTHSSVKTVWFELISGAVSMSTVKFSLQSDGTFSNHDQGDADTFFRYGTAGGGNAAAGSGSQENDQVEFPVDADGLGRIVATDIDSDTPPSYLFATQENLAVVSSADDAETVGNYLEAVVSDFIWLAIKLGANETGANSTINYRMFFDFS
jgi:hypothetical protein